MRNGCVHIYTGEGKGKTTAAVGLALRAKSRGLNVLFVQIMKTDIEGGELSMLQRISVVVKRYDEIRSPLFHPDTDLQDNRQKALNMLKEISAVATEYDLVIIDEFNNLVKNNIIHEKEAVEFIRAFPEDVELVLTGRGATETMMEVADYVTYMKQIKHPHTTGLKAREGIEY